MRRLLEIEYYKIRYHKASFRLLLCYFLLFPMLYFFSTMEFRFGSLSATLDDVGVLKFPFIWHFGTYITLYLKFILVIVVITSVTGEYSNNTLKQNLIDGLSKKEFVFSKVAMVAVLSLLSVLLSFTTLFFIGWKNSPVMDWSLVFSELDYFLGYFVRLFSFLVFGIFSAILLRRSAMALGFMIIWSIVESIIRIALTTNFKEIGSTIGSLFPLTSMSNTVSEPFQRIQIVQSISEQLGQQIELVHGVNYLPLIQTLLWSVIFVYFSYRILKVRDF